MLLPFSYFPLCLPSSPSWNLISPSSFSFMPSCFLPCLPSPLPSLLFLFTSLSLSFCSSLPFFYFGSSFIPYSMYLLYPSLLENRSHQSFLKCKTSPQSRGYKMLSNLWQHWVSGKENRPQSNSPEYLKKPTSPGVYIWQILLFSFRVLNLSLQEIRKRSSRRGLLKSHSWQQVTGETWKAKDL